MPLDVLDHIGTNETPGAGGESPALNSKRGFRFPAVHLTLAVFAPSTPPHSPPWRDCEGGRRGYPPPPHPLPIFRSRDTIFLFLNQVQFCLGLFISVQSISFSPLPPIILAILTSHEARSNGVGIKDIGGTRDCIRVRGDKEGGRGRQGRRVGAV
eukprot:Hpha_TRINITY_DN16389_c1_g4::TRINITY_DN16389_c1_g4_i1::g.60053::m.60053